MSAKKTASKTKTTSKTKVAKKTKVATKTAAPKGDGYKGHRKGTLKEKLHIIFDQNKKNPDKARELALKLKDDTGQIAVGTVNTSFSQFRQLDK
jgi:hypothetical protein